jgi:hypothetical protein
MSKRPSFIELKGDLAWDGSLRDIYVLNTSASDWDRLGSTLETSGLTLTQFADGQRAPFPASLANHIADPQRNASLLVIGLTDHLAINCHFFTAEEIEFDFDPRFVQGDNDFARLLDFMACIAQGLGKPVLLTPENLPGAPILSCDPHTGSWLYWPPRAR